MESKQVASWLVKAGLAVMVWDTAIGLAQVTFRDWHAPGAAVSAFLPGMALFAVAYLGVLKPLRKETGPSVNLTILFSMLRLVPLWAKLAWAATLIAVLVLMSGVRPGTTFGPRTELLFIVMGFYFALSSSLIAWAKLREARPAAAG